jgi:hypothetical protein
MAIRGLIFLGVGVETNNDLFEKEKKNSGTSWNGTLQRKECHFSDSSEDYVRAGEVDVIAFWFFVPLEQVTS